MAQYLIPNNSTNNQSINLVGFKFNTDRIVTIVPTGTVKLYDNNNNLIKTILGSDPEISTKEG
jgi:hypothetical protein